MNQPANSNGGSKPPGTQEVQVQARVISQYIKDMSFESPNMAKLVGGQLTENPNLNLDLNVNPQRIDANLYETILAFKARAESRAVGVVFELEVEYAGLFRVESAPPEALEAMLNVHFPALLFPFLRRIVSDVTRDGGIMPPLMLDPVDFGALYMRKRAAQNGQPAA